MRITNVKIENFRCFESIELGFENLQALIGVNGTGKTSILEAIDFATSKEYASRKINEQDFNNLDKGSVKIEIIFDGYFVRQLKDGYITKNLLCDGVVLTVKRRDKASPGKLLSDGFPIEHLVKVITYDSINKINAEFLPKDFTLGDFPSSVERTSAGFKAPRKNGSNWEIAIQELSINGDVKSFPSVFYFDRQRELEAKIGYNSLLQKIARELNWRYRKKVDLQETIKRWEPYYENVVGTVEDTKTHTYLDPLRTEITKILGNNYDNLEISLLNIEQPFTQALFSLRNSRETNQIEFSGLGSGVCTVIAYLLLKTVSSLSKEEIIFLIDEPEMHLHPQAQASLFKEFLEAKYQIVYTTHSDQLVSLKNWPSVKRFDIKCEGYPKNQALDDVLEGKSIKDHLDEIKTWHIDETIYFRENNELFFARKVLLVEGPAEKYGIPRLANVLGKDLKEVSIISCNGKTKIPHYQLLCRAFDIPYFTLFDLDGASINQADNKRPGEWATNNCLEKFSTSFESLLGINTSGEHKGSETLIRIDSISGVSEIHDEIKQAIEKISEWASNN